MEQVKVFHDTTGNTLTVWFTEPQQEFICEETGEEVVLMKDKTGKVIGFEKLNFSSSPEKQAHIDFESLTIS